VLSLPPKRRETRTSGATFYFFDRWIHVLKKDRNVLRAMPAAAEAAEDTQPVERIIGKEASFKKLAVASLTLALALAARRWTGPQSGRLQAAQHEDKQSTAAPAADLPALSHTLARFEHLSEAAAALCQTPSAWLQPSPLSAGMLQQRSDEYIASMLWGTYLPSLFFGFRTRTSPAMFAGGLLWGGAGSGRSAASLR
jgi:Glycosyl hydrolase family 63 N-terminal domain